MKTITHNLPKCEDCAIRKMALFGELETKYLDKARALRSCQMTFQPDEYLYREGDAPNTAMTIHDGWVILFKDLEGGKRQILRFALAGDLLSYKTGNNDIIDHSAIAVTEVTVCAFPIQGFKDTIAELPELFFAINSITEILSARCLSTMTTIANYNAETNVAYLLLSLYIRGSAHCDTLNQDKMDGILFPFTQEDIGDALGLTAIHVNRVFQKLRKQDLIECNNKNLRIADEEKLAGVAQADLGELKRLLVAI